MLPCQIFPLHSVLVWVVWLIFTTTPVVKVKLLRTRTSWQWHLWEFYFKVWIITHLMTNNRHCGYQTGWRHRRAGKYVGHLWNLRLGRRIKLSHVAVSWPNPTPIQLQRSNLLLRCLMSDPPIELWLWPLLVTIVIISMQWFHLHATRHSS